MKKFSLVLVLIFLVSSCAPDATIIPPTKRTTASIVPTTNHTSTPSPTMTSTETLSPTEIPPTKTPSWPLLTLDDWKNEVFIGQFPGGDLKYYDLSKIFTINDVSTDPQGVRNIQYGCQVMILNPSGKVEVSVEPSNAAERINEGATVLIAPDDMRSMMIWAIYALSQAYTRGNQNLSIEINRTSCRHDTLIDLNVQKYLLLQTNENGEIFSPIFKKMPEGLVKIGVMWTPEKLTFQEAGFGIDETDPPENWLDIILNAGYDRLTFDLRS